MEHGPFIDGLPMKIAWWIFPWRTVNVITRWYISWNLLNIFCKIWKILKAGPRGSGISDIWVNYNELTTSSLEIMVSKGNHPQMAQQFRLVNNLPRSFDSAVCIASGESPVAFFPSPVQGSGAASCSSRHTTVCRPWDFLTENPGVVYMMWLDDIPWCGYTYELDLLVNVRI